MAVITSLLRPPAFHSMVRALRIMRASFHVMKRGLMSYGLLSGTKPIAPHSTLNAPPEM